MKNSETWRSGYYYRHGTAQFHLQAEMQHIQLAVMHAIPQVERVHRNWPNRPRGGFAKFVLYFRVAKIGYPDMFRSPLNIYQTK